MGIFNLFKPEKRKLTSIRHYMAYLECNPKSEFQLDIYSDNKVDVQIFSEKANTSFTGKNQITLLLAFTKHLKTRDKSLESFFNQDFFTTSRKMKSELEDRYCFNVERPEKNMIKIHKLVSKILKDIYFYDENTKYSVHFMELLENGEYINVKYVDKRGKRVPRSPKSD